MSSSDRPPSSSNPPSPSSAPAPSSTGSSRDTDPPRFNAVTSAWNAIAAPIQQLIGNDLWGGEGEKVAEILAKVREELPTTEALLVGKPQAGKSSIVRGLTGAPAEIVGQGFRPHTQHTEQYAYPSEELPLLLFTDTVGLGDIERDTQVLVDELLLDLREKPQGARIFILTVKINDFATDSLCQIARQLRQAHPEIPCLLAITCLHELYPTLTDRHPDYPPEYESIQEAFAAHQQTFAELCDRSLLLDFTLEEDGFDPTFYGLEQLRDTLADMLPEAEAQAIAQLLTAKSDSTLESASSQIGEVYRQAGRQYSMAFAVMAAAVSAVPLPFATMPMLTALQISLVGLLGKLYGQTLSPSQVGGIASTIAGGFLARAVGRELLKFVPGLGTAIAASWAAAYTWALGEGACVYFGDLMGGKTPSPEKIRGAIEQALEEAKDRFKSAVR
ncbi:MAG: GTPase [Cyanobacteria bacterium P01_E01_bin.45]